MAQFCRTHITYLVCGVGIALSFITILNRPLGIALFLLVILGSVTMLGLLKAGFKDKNLYILFCIALFIYLIFTLGIYYTQFYPFGGGEGDQWWNQRAAVAISNDFLHGNFSLSSISWHLQENFSPQWFPVLFAILYTFSIPSEIVGLMLVVWFAALSSALLYLLARELGASQKWAFIGGLTSTIYPSFLYFSGLLIRESIVALFFLCALLFIVKLIKQFSWPIFLVMYVVLFFLTSFRFYAGFVMLYSFVLILPWLGIPNWKTKLRFATAIFLMLGFLPQLFGFGYYGISYATNFLSPRQITAYREFPVKLHSSEIVPRQAPEVSNGSPSIEVIPELEQAPKAPGLIFPRGEYRKYDEGSTIIVKPDFKNPIAFIKSYLVSFVYVLLGPFPWQIRYARQVFALGESIPWLFAFFFIVKGAIHERRNYRLILPVLLASIGLIAAIALLINNYGTFMRIRIPAFLALLSLLPFAFGKHEDYS